MNLPSDGGIRIQLVPTKKPIKVVVFDCDGVLFDSRQANVHFYNHVLAFLGYPPVRPDQEDYIHMHSAQQSLRYLLGDGREFEVAWSYCRSMDFRQFHTHMRVEPGLIQFLQALKSTYGIALATNRTISTHELLTHFQLDHYFDLVVTAADVVHPKPHPESMERIRSVFSVTPEEILYIGDSPVDEALALATNILFVAYKNPQLKAHFHIDHFQQLYSLFFLHPTRGQSDGLQTG
jgi:phosphoglycolate phosphatase